MERVEEAAEKKNANRARSWERKEKNCEGRVSVSQSLTVEKCVLTIKRHNLC